MKKNALKILDNFFIVQKGFKRKGNVWYKIVSDVVQLFQFQSSWSSKGFFINVGIHFLGIGSEEFTNYSNCHLDGRYDLIINNYHEEYTIPLDVELEILHENLIKHIKNIEEQILPELKNKYCDINYMVKIFPHDFPSDKYYLCHITRETLISYLNIQTRLS